MTIHCRISDSFQVTTNQDNLPVVKRPLKSSLLTWIVSNDAFRIFSIKMADQFPNVRWSGWELKCDEKTIMTRDTVIEPRPTLASSGIGPHSKLVLYVKADPKTVNRLPKWDLQVRCDVNNRPKHIVTLSNVGLDMTAGEIRDAAYHALLTGQDKKNRLEMVALGQGWTELEWHHSTGIMSLDCAKDMTVQTSGITKQSRLVLRTGNGSLTDEVLKPYVGCILDAIFSGTLKDPEDIVFFIERHYQIPIYYVAIKPILDWLIEEGSIEESDTAFFKDAGQ